MMFPKERSNKAYHELVFWVGIIATLSYRIIVVLNFYSQLWVDIAWNIGTVGFIWYFIYRFSISSRRAKAIEAKKLIEKIESKKELNASDRQTISLILKGLKTSKAKINYFVIFVSSALALAYSVVIRFID
ncbi:hypothetical protein GF382_01110 [Candidatus Falkowbacteria bacterium]|nr:hypothetical protein [Candidatus Falkowbacteria bacterium]